MRKKVSKRSPYILAHLDEDGKPRTEVLDLWMRNPIEVIADIIGNPTFKDCTVFEPVQKVAAGPWM